jgi:putative tryptophan/tyrosine transport system substrate-binding protein
MRRRAFLAALGAAAAWPFAAGAQPNGRIRVIAVLRDVSEEDDRRLGLIAALREGLRDLGYVEGENLRIETRYAGPRYAGEQFGRLEQSAAELVGLKVEVIVTAGPGVDAARVVTTTVPIVIAAYGDVVAMGLAESLSHPGGNVTGLTTLSPQLASKRLELLEQAQPSLTRVGLILQGRSDAPSYRSMLDLVNGTAAKLKIEIVPIAVAGAADVERALSDAPGGPVGGFLLVGGPIEVDSALIADVAQRRGLPSIGAPMYASAGGLLGYGQEYAPLWRRATTFVDKILKGAKPGDIPIEQLARFKSVVNLKTAKALGIDIPLTLLAAADEVIE